VYRENGINIPTTNIDTFGWTQLEYELKKREGQLVSISGGGDPLYNYDNIDNKRFYSKLFILLEKYDCRLELHTSLVNRWFPYEQCERVVFHLTMPNQIAMLSILNKKVDLRRPIIRVVYVVQEYYTKYLINEIVKEVGFNKDIEELSFRQMIDKNGKTTFYLYDYLKNGHKKNWYYIEQCDYNDYFVNDHIETNYLNIK
jgi:hypothetical protein